jgi:hypothetical protein
MGKAETEWRALSQAAMATDSLSTFLAGKLIQTKEYRTQCEQSSF